MWEIICHDGNRMCPDADDPMAGLHLRRTNAAGSRGGCWDRCLTPSLSQPPITSGFIRMRTGGEGLVSVSSSTGDSEDQVQGPRNKLCRHRAPHALPTFGYFSAFCYFEEHFCEEILEHIFCVFLRIQSSPSEWLDLRAHTLLKAFYKRC